MESFIKKVRKKPCLWDTCDPSFNNMKEKDSMWELVAQECGLSSGNDARKQWKKLQHSYREAMRRRRFGTPSQKLGPWKYEKQMRFLYYAKNENVNETYESEHETERECSPHDNDCKEEFTTPTKSIETYNSYMIEGKESVDSKCRITEKIRKEKKLERIETRREMFDSNRKKDPLRALFYSLCEKTRNLPKYLQIRVERELFDIVSKAEEEALNPVNLEITPEASALCKTVLIEPTS